MHEILKQILETKDLAKAGDLFSISDEKIEKDCSRYVEPFGIAFWYFTRISLLPNAMCSYCGYIQIHQLWS